MTAAVTVEIDPFIRETAAQSGADVPYALKALAGQLVDDPDLGRPSELPGILTVTVDGDMFDDCPDLTVGYIREPDRIQIRFLRPAPSTEDHSADHEADQNHDHDQEPGRDQARPADPAATAVTVRQIADAWQRVTGWLKSNAPDSYAALRAGAEPAAVAAVEKDLGIRIPVELRALWMLTGGDGRGCLPGNEALMPLDAVAAFHRLKMDAQSGEDADNARRPEDEWITVWRATWIPVVSLGPADRCSGLYLDAATGYLGRWSRYDNAHGEGELDTLVTYLEEAADMLEAPALATRDKPGLVGGTLVWLSGVDPAVRDCWRPLAV
jgi:cell wall assembly regulator SMI1